MSNNHEHHHDLIGDISKNADFDDDIKNNPGFGKPLPKNLLKGDTYANFLNTAKEAGFLPPWIKLQKEIKAQLTSLLHLIEENKHQPEVNMSLRQINEKIKKYNRSCPPPMQRGLIHLDTIHQQVKRWE